MTDRWDTVSDRTGTPDPKDFFDLLREHRRCRALLAALVQDHEPWCEICVNNADLGQAHIQAFAAAREALKESP